MLNKLLKTLGDTKVDKKFLSVFALIDFDRVMSQ